MEGDRRKRGGGHRPRENLATDLGEVVTQGDRVVAGVEDEERKLFSVWKKSDHLADLCDGGGRRVLAWCDSHDVKRRCPRVKGPVQLADPL